LAETKTNDYGQFDIRATETRGSDTSLYLLATGGVPTAYKGSVENPSIALLAVLGNKPPTKVTINEFTTLASVMTHTQFLNGTAIQGRALPLRIAAGNVPNFRESRNWRLRHDNSGRSQQRSDADDGQLLHAFQRARRLRHDDPTRRLRQSLLRGLAHRYRTSAEIPQIIPTVQIVPIAVQGSSSHPFSESIMLVLWEGID
jgi:hypothetical protein